MELFALGLVVAFAFALGLVVAFAFALGLVVAFAFFKPPVCISVFWLAVEQVDADLLVIGEMGIGNTTVAAAITAALLGGEPSSWVGRGTGVDQQGYERNIEEEFKSIYDSDPKLREVLGGAAALAQLNVKDKY